MAENLLINTTLQGITFEAKAYNPMGNGFTDRMFILGHADSLPLNDPYQVVDFNATIIALHNDISSPLFKALLEAYYSGARDIWIVPVARMSEYNADLTTRDNTYYTTYKNRLQVAYDILLDWDLVQMIVPVDAPYYDAKGVDFLTQLSNHCASAFANTGVVRLGFIGTRITGTMNQSLIDTMASDPRLDSLTDGKYVAVCIGEGLFNFQELPILYVGSVNVAAAGQYSAMPPWQSLTFTRLSAVNNYANGRITDAQIAQLSNAKLNPLWKTTRGERNQLFQTVLFSDNTLAQDGSDFWSLPQVRLCARVMSDIRNLGNMFIGNIGFTTFQQKVNSYFLNLFQSNYLKKYSVNVVRDPSNLNGVLVNIAITPYFGVRQLLFTIQVGPTGS